MKTRQRTTRSVNSTPSQRKTSRRSASSSSSSSIEESMPSSPPQKKKARKSANEAVAKAAAATTKTSPKKKTVKKNKSPDTVSKTAESSSSAAANESSKGSKNNPPWFTMFTKNDEQYFRYMATEWGFEKRGDEALFEKLSLEGAQAGLSWLSILRKREAYRRTFHDFDIDSVAAMTEEDVEEILSQDSANKCDIVIRNRGKIESVINNAKCIQKMRQESEEEESGEENSYGHGVFDHFLWSFVNNQPIVNTTCDPKDMSTVPSKSNESEAMSKALKKIGFKFVGPTTCYSMMQSVGMVIDHPYYSPEWKKAMDRLKKRKGGYQMR